MNMTDIKWRFRKMSPAEVNQGTVVREFFEDEPINTRLVREVIQNSLDAGVDKVLGNPIGTTGPVRVRFSLAGILNPLPYEKASRYFAGIAPHLVGIDDLDTRIRERAASANLVSDGVPYIVVEDAGTMGLGGDWREYDTTDGGNHFYWFFRNVGLSGKGDSDNGSWGLGKWVFPDASQISAYLAITRRQDGETLLMGQTVLSKHSINGQRYDPIGYFAVTGDDGLPLPLRTSEPEQRLFIEQCIADFDLQFRSSSGLSVVIPFPRIGGTLTIANEDYDDAGISRDELLAAVVHNYFYPIIAGNLEVIIDSGDGTAPMLVAKDTIDGIVKQLPLPATGEHSSESYRRLFDMCRASLRCTDEDYEVLDAPPSANRDRYDVNQLAAWRNRYQAGEMLAFRIGTVVQRRGGESQDTTLRLYLQRDQGLTEGHDYYVRGTLSIHGNMDFIRRRREVCALLVVDQEEPLAAMLRDSEPPAHTSWRQRTSRVANRWERPRVRIDEVRNTPGNLLTLLEPPTEEVQKDAFTDIFFWDGSDERHTERRVREGPTDYGMLPNPPERQPQVFDIAQIEGGFRVRLASGLTNPPARVRLRVAYEIPRGNPLSRYSPEDFLLHGRDALPHQMGGCEVRRGSAGNDLFLDIDDPEDFEFAVSGFDPLRDVYVRIERISEMEGDDADTTV